MKNKSKTALKKSERIMFLKLLKIFYNKSKVGETFIMKVSSRKIVSLTLNCICGGYFVYGLYSPTYHYPLSAYLP